MAIACSTSLRSGSSLEEAIRSVSQLGFAKVDLLAIDGWVHIHPSELVSDWDAAAARLDRMLSNGGLAPIALNTGTGAQLHDRSLAANLGRRQQMMAILRLMRAYGIGIAAIQPLRSDSGRPWSDVLRDCVATLREYGAMGREAGVTFALELHVDSPFETMEQTKRLVEMMPEVQFVYDPTHFVMQGYDIRETEWLMDRARHVHLRDAAVGLMQTRFGTGAVDFDWVLSTLAAKGYAGHFSIEYLEMDGADWSPDVLAVRDAIRRYFPE